MKTPITVRIDAELLVEARRCARAENRTLTNFIETLLRDRVGEHSPALPASVQPKRPVLAGNAKDSPPHAT